jgi:2'-5' RNA ligase
MNHITLKHISEIPTVKIAEEIKERLEEIVPTNKIQARGTQMYIDAVKRRINELTN